MLSRFLSPSLLPALCTSAFLMGAPLAQAANVPLQPTTATITFDATQLVRLSSFFGTPSATGSGQYAAGSFSASIASASVPASVAAPVTLTWAADAGLRFTNSLASFTFVGFEFDAATSIISSDVVFTPTVGVGKTYSSVAFLKLTGLSGTLNGDPLSLVSPSSPALASLITGSATLLKDGLNSIILDLDGPFTLPADLPIGTATFLSTAVTPPPTPAVPEPAVVGQVLAGSVMAGMVLLRRRRATKN